MNILIPVSAGDLVDRTTILRIKCERIPDPAKRENVRREFEHLARVRTELPDLNSEAVKEIEQRLYDTNQRLWDIEDALRVFESKKQFGVEFVDAARNVYLTNDIRAGLKKDIDRIVGSFLSDEKWFSVAAP